MSDRSSAHAGELVLGIATWIAFVGGAAFGVRARTRRVDGLDFVDDVVTTVG